MAGPVTRAEAVELEAVVGMARRLSGEREKVAVRAEKMRRSRNGIWESFTVGIFNLPTSVD